MCCTKKWVGGLAALALLVVGLGVVSGTGAGRWVLGHAWVQVQKVCGWAEKQVSIEDEITRIGNEVDGINGDLAREYDKVAAQRREIRDLEKDITAHRAKLDKQWDAIDQLSALLEKAKSNDASFVVIEGKKSDLPIIRADLADRWDTFKKGKESLKKKEELLEKGQAVLTKMNENMKNLVTAQDDLRLKLKDLENQLKAARLAEVNNRTVAVSEELKNRLTHIDDSITKVQDKIDDVVEQAKADANRPTVKKDVGIDAHIKANTAEDEIQKFRQSKLAADK